MKLYLHQPKGKHRTVTLLPAQTLLQALQQDGQALPAPCGGTGRCGKCSLLVTAGVWPPTTADHQHFTPKQMQEGWRLACQMTGGQISKMGTVSTPENHRPSQTPETHELHETHGLCETPGASGRVEATEVVVQLPHLADPPAEPPSEAAKEEDPPMNIGSHPLFRSSALPQQETGIAIDLGTTTLGFRLIDRKTGVVLRETACMNRQQQYGADVVARIQQATQGHLKAMATLIREDLLLGMAALTRDFNGNSPEKQLTGIVIAGNTTMLHLLQELSPAGMGQHPFTPVTLEMTTLPFHRLFSEEVTREPHQHHLQWLLSHLSACPVTLLPGLDAFVGADITAGIYHTRLHESEAVSLLVDIGTNGEMVVGNRHGLTATATAAGPAFEGGSLSCGMAGVPGAIHALTWEGDTFHLKTIDDRPPTGICGSGVVDLMAEGLRHGWMDATGRLLPPWQEKKVVLATPSGAPPIQVTQKDIREVQLATAAIRAGIQCLLETAAIPVEAVQRVYLAGGFGSHMNLASALTMGLLPAPLADQVVMAGNTCLSGAADLLTDADAPDKLQQIVKLTTTLNLSTSDCFQKAFLKAMTFPQHQPVSDRPLR